MSAERACINGTELTRLDVVLVAFSDHTHDGSVVVAGAVLTAGRPGVR